MMLKKMIALVFAVFSFAAQADYSLTVTNSGDGHLIDSYPSFTLVSSDNAVGSSLTSYTQTFDEASTITFNWTYSTSDEGSGYDPAGYALNGILYQLTSDSSGVSSGTVTVSVAAGDSFGWYVNSVDSAFGSGVLEITVSAVPEPATYAMLLAGLGMIGFAARRRT